MTDDDTRRHPEPGELRSCLRVADVAHEAVEAVGGRIWRSLLTALGTIVGVAAAVATLGILGTANHQISSDFDAATSVQVTVSDLGSGNIDVGSEARARRVVGVARAGISWQVAQSASIATDQDPLRSGIATQDLPLFAASPAGLRVTGAEPVQGRLFDAGNAARADRVALLGAVTARNLDISSVVNAPTVFVEGSPFTVVGIIQGSGRQPGALTGVTIPATTALRIDPLRRAHAGDPDAPAVIAAQGHGPTLFVETRTGAAQVVGPQLPVAMLPRSQHDLAVALPPDPRTLRRQVQGTTGALVFFLAGLALLIGVVAIANSTLLAVIERTPEFGLRRALGARPIHIATAVLVETTLVGAIGGLLGTSLGVIVTAAVAVSRSWTAVIDPRFVVLAPIAGVLAGFLAGALPARRAMSIEPATALQRL